MRPRGRLVPCVAASTSASARASGVTASASNSARARCSTVGSLPRHAAKRRGRSGRLARRRGRLRRASRLSASAPPPSLPPPAPSPGGRSLMPDPFPDLLQRTLPIAMLCLAVIAVPLLVLQPAGLPRLKGLEKELRDVTAENAELRRDVTRLRVEVDELRDDPAAVERIARDQLGMVRRSEVVFQFGK